MPGSRILMFLSLTMTLWALRVWMEVTPNSRICCNPNARTYITMFTSFSLSHPSLTLRRYR